jgi:hypothetical protein
VDLEKEHVKHVNICMRIVQLRINKHLRCGRKREIKDNKPSMTKLIQFDSSTRLNFFFY